MYLIQKNKSSLCGGYCRRYGQDLRIKLFRNEDLYANERPNFCEFKEIIMEDDPYVVQDTRGCEELYRAIRPPWYKRLWRKLWLKT